MATDVGARTEYVVILFCDRRTRPPCACALRLSCDGCAVLGTHQARPSSKQRTRDLGRLRSLRSPFRPLCTHCGSTFRCRTRHRCQKNSRSLASSPGLRGADPRPILRRGGGRGGEGGMKHARSCDQRNARSGGLGVWASGGGQPLAIARNASPAIKMNSNFGRGEARHLKAQPVAAAARSRTHQPRPGCRRWPPPRRAPTRQAALTYTRGRLFYCGCLCGVCSVSWSDGARPRWRRRRTGEGCVRAALWPTAWPRAGPRV